MNQAIDASRTRPITSVLIVGGGTAGWLTASILAAKHQHSNLSITLIEAPDIPIIGVGEGTWPSMRSTLHSVGIMESDFIKECDASFKQGSKFVAWHTGNADDYYYHPFDLPRDFNKVNLAQHWVNTQPDLSFSKLSCVQEHLCEANLSPKLKHSGNYSGVSNYGYHLNAGKFSEFLKKHCVEKLNVKLVLDKVCHVESHKTGECAGDIAYVKTENSGDLHADLFIDCTGFRSLLLGQHCGIKFIDKSQQFPINSALAVQVPYQEDQAITSATVSTAQQAGWIWDIGLSSRRGVGHVFSDSHTSEDQALRDLQSYLNLDDNNFNQLEPRRIAINPGYREKFWHNNCVGVGLSAGFLEPLEASAMMLIETSASMIADLMPTTRAAMDVVSLRFNRRSHYRWQRIIDFLKLHYHLSQRTEAFWRDAASADHVSDRLKEDLELWRHQAPWKAEFDSLEEAFPAASYQYVLYGMGFNTRGSEAVLNGAAEAINSVTHEAQLLSSKLESNRDILSLIHSA